MNALPALKWLGVAEMVTLGLMLLNIVTVHEPLISSIMGPSHGLAYTGTVIAGILASGGRQSVWLLSLVPGIGGWLAYRAASKALRTTDAI